MVLLLALGSILAAQAPSKQESRPGVEIVEVSASRADNRIMVDGRVRNIWDRPLTKLVLVVELLDSERKLIGQRRGAVEEESLEPGDEVPFHFYLPLQARSIQVRLAAEAARVPHVEVRKPGPYPIE